MRRRSNLFCVLFLFFIFSCDISLPGTKYCWGLVDEYGGAAGEVCGKSLSQMKAEYPDACRYYRQGRGSCWLADQLFIENKSEGYVDFLIRCKGSVAVKVDCGDCMNWYNRQKHVHKESGYFFFTRITSAGYCGDTLKSLYNRREIILRETADSLIIVQFSNDAKF